MKSLENYTTIIFDLDNTLYNEIEYLSRAYKFIGNKISECNKQFLSQDIYIFLIEEFKSKGRKNIYQKLKRNYGGTGEGASVKYRSGEGRS